MNNDYYYALSKETPTIILLLFGAAVHMAYFICLIQVVFR
jgi:hypothetical protein